MNYRLVVALLLIAGPTAGADEAPPRPNIVFIFIDDMGHGDLSCFGNRDCRTPNIDRLAEQGIRLSQFYVGAPICSPSRVAVTTGQFPARHRINSYLATRKRNRERHMADFLDPTAPSLARTLHKAGYATAHFGKWHMGGGRDVRDAPLPRAYGFDEHFVNFEGMGPKIDRKNTPKHLWTETYVDKTIDFIGRHRRGPFYVNLWPNDVHDAHVPKPALMEKYKAFAANPYRQKFFAVLDEMDRQIGRLIDAIDRMGLRENTLIVLTSDNGPTDWPFYYEKGLDPPGSVGQLRGRKWSLYEGGIRMPLIAHWPGHVPAGQFDQTSVMAAVDLFPTLCRLARVDPPADVAFDGQDMSGVLLGRPIERQRPILWEYRRDDTYLKPGDPKSISPNLAIRDGRWKLLINADGTDAQLYDLLADPREQNDLAASQPEITDRLSKTVRDWRESLP